MNAGVSTLAIDAMIQMRKNSEIALVLLERFQEIRQVVLFSGFLGEKKLWNETKVVTNTYHSPGNG